MKRIIVGISGASGAILGIRLLEELKKLKAETHLIISRAAQITIAAETSWKPEKVRALATHSHNVDDISACISSGSFRTDGMIIAPCSIKTMSEIATGVTSTLLSRSADVILKEKKKLVLMVRETPLHAGHLHNMEALANLGAIIYPPVLSLYPNPQTVEDMVSHTIGRVLDIFDFDHDLVKRWQGTKKYRNN